MTILSNQQLMSIPPPERVQTGVECLDSALGGGYVPGTVILLTGVPGVGKTSLLTRALPDGTVYNNNEESAASLAYKSHLLGLNVQRNFTWILDKSVRSVFEHVALHRPPVLVIDSVQETNVTDPAAVAEACHNLAESTGITVFLVGHVNAKGKHFGAERVRHWIDVHLHLVGRNELVVLKNRFPALQIEGPVEEPEEVIDLGSLPPPSLVTPKAPQSDISVAEKAWIVVRLVVMAVVVLVSAPIIVLGFLTRGSRR